MGTLEDRTKIQVMVYSVSIVCIKSKQFYDQHSENVFISHDLKE